MSAPTRPTRQAAGGTPLGLALLLERSGVRLVAPSQTLAPGFELLEFVASFPGPRPATAASCRERACRAEQLRLRVEAEGLMRWLRARLERAQLPGWRVEHVAWDMLEGTGGSPWRWTLRGAADCGATVWLRIELQARAAGGSLIVEGRRCWLLGPPELDCGRIWRGLVRRLGRGPGLMGCGPALVIDAARASLGPGFAAAGWRLPAYGRLQLGLATTREAVTLSLEDAAAGVVSWPEGQVMAERRTGPEDPLAQVRGWLRGDPRARARADAALLELASGLASSEPALASALLRARALALRFVARERCGAALREWLQVAPGDGEARWLLAVQRASAGDAEGLSAALRGASGEVVGVRRRLALALTLQGRERGAREALALLEAMIAELPGCAQELQTAVWRALARSRAGDRATPATEVLSAVSAALGEEGWRRREEAGELRAQVAAALVMSGRPEAETTPLLRRLLGDVGPGRAEASAGQAGRRERGEGRASARIVSEYLAQEGRWPELVAVLGRQLVRLGGAPRIQALRRIARIHQHHLREPGRAEQALRSAMEQVGEDAPTRREREEAGAELVSCLELQGRKEEAARLREAMAAAAVMATVVEAAGVLGDRSGERASGEAEGVLGDRSGEGAADMLAAVVRGEPLVRFGALSEAAQVQARWLEARGESAGARSWWQLAGFLAPQGADAEEVEAARAQALPADVWVQEAEPGESRAALWAALRVMAGETAGIRAPGAGQTGQTEAMALAEAELGPLRAALGLALPVRPGCGAAQGGVAVRNERPPAIGVGTGLVGLSVAERRFRLGFAAVMIAGGLAIVTDPQGASLPELLAALHHLADETGSDLARLPGAQTIVRALAARGFTGERLPAALREALARELAAWQQSRESVARLARLLRRDSLRVALRLSGTLEGALQAVYRDARLYGPPDEQGARQVLASAEGQCLLRAAGLLA